MNMGLKDKIIISWLYVRLSIGYLVWFLSGTLWNIMEHKKEIEMESSDAEESNHVHQMSKLSRDQVSNSAGGFVYKVDDINRVRRFLCLGVEGGTYYSSENKLTVENAQCIQEMIKNGKGKELVEEIANFSEQGRAAKQDSTIFALALCARQEKDKSVKELAYKKLPVVCRIPTHLFSFVDFSEQTSRGTGWGRAQRRAISNWYLSHEKEAMRLAMHVTKYRSRNGWAHKDLLRLSHPKPKSKNIEMIIKYIVKGINVAKTFVEEEKRDKELTNVFEFLQATEDVKSTTTDGEIVSLIEKYGLVREHIPTNNLNSPLVWEALLQKMPMTAMIRNLAKMTTIGLLKEESNATSLIAQRLNDDIVLKRARIHPFNVLTALQTYQKGKGDKGKLTWKPVQLISQALNNAFYKSFKFVEPTGLRYLLALDVSGSMSWGGCIGNSSISPRDGAAAMSMVTARTESNHQIVGFSYNLVNLPIKKDMRLDTVIQVMDAVPMGTTDCAQPMIYAKDKKLLFDVFIIYTDSETYCGNIHPSVALREYRKSSGIWNAKLIVCGMTASKFTVADPEDPGMLDIAGFDSAAPELIRNFSLGLI